MRSVPLLMLVTVACGTTTAVNQQHLAWSSRDDAARVYLLRSEGDSILDEAISFELNGHTIATLASGEYVVLRLPAGEYTLAAYVCHHFGEHQHEHDAPLHYNLTISDSESTYLLVESLSHETSGIGRHSAGPRNTNLTIQLINPVAAAAVAMRLQPGSGSEPIPQATAEAAGLWSAPR